VDAAVGIPPVAVGGAEAPRNAAPGTAADHPLSASARCSCAAIQADYSIVVLAIIFAWALRRGKIKANPLENPGRFYQGSRREKIWSRNDEAAFLAKAPPHTRLPFLLAIWTGQRQGDLLTLPWTGYDGQFIKLRQSKTGARISVPVGKPLKA